MRKPCRCLLSHNSYAWIWTGRRSLLGAVLLAVAMAAIAQVPKQAVSGAIHPHGRMPLTEFYDTPSPLPPARPGSLIRSEQFDGYSLPLGIVTTRFLYHSRSSAGEDVAVSGVIIVPDSQAPPNGWPIIAWAHTFQGVARQCAPSLLENLGEGSYFSMYVKLGYAVVVTDYAGLGTSFPTSAVNLRSESEDVIYAVPAARSAVTQLGSRWIAMGEEDGGGVAVGVAELESEMRDPNFLGSIALGGLIDFENVADRWVHDSPMRMIYLAYAIKVALPPFDPSDMLTAEAIESYPKEIRSCEGTEEVPSLLTAEKVLRPNWKENEFVKEYFQSNALGRRAVSRPLLVLASRYDSTTTNAMTTQMVKRLCQRGDRLLFQEFDSPNSRTLVGDSVSAQIAWIRGRFSNQAAMSNCN